MQGQSYHYISYISFWNHRYLSLRYQLFFQIFIVYNDIVLLKLICGELCHIGILFYHESLLGIKADSRELVDIENLH